MTGNPVAMAQTTNSTPSLDTSELASSSSTADEEMVISTVNPNKIHRTFPLRKQNQDPAQCYDILDSMYEIYYTEEVR